MISFNLETASTDPQTVVSAIMAHGYTGTTVEKLHDRIETIMRSNANGTTSGGVQAVVLDEFGCFFGLIWHAQKEFLGGFIGARGKKIHKPSSWAGELSYFVERLEYYAKEYEDEARPHTLKVGDVLRYSWGVEQTNISFYEVVKVTARSVVYREIEKEIAYNADANGNSDSMTGTATPMIGNYIGEPVTTKADGNNSVKMPHGRAYKLESSMLFGARIFEPSNWTAYA